MLCSDFSMVLRLVVVPYNPLLGTRSDFLPPIFRRNFSNAHLRVCDGQENQLHTTIRIYDERSVSGASFDAGVVC
jgi:hypothetical protein